MIALALEVNGVVRRVQVSRDGGRVVVELDGVRHVLDAVETEKGRWSLLFDEHHESHELLVRSGQAGEWIVLVDGAVVPVRTEDPRQAGDRRPAGSGPVRLTAPMPGKVVAVLVAAGQAVEARQPLVVVEAMKMENELRAPRAGIIADVAACAGALVEAGALLLTIA